MTAVHVHELMGLKPDAPATYLAALAVIRLLAEQTDARARGFWRDEHFALVTELDWQALEQFFLEDYRPTPILAPRKLESGFFSLKPLNDAEGINSAGSATLRDEEEGIDGNDAESDLHERDEDGADDPGAREHKVRKRARPRAARTRRSLGFGTGARSWTDDRHCAQTGGRRRERRAHDSLLTDRRSRPHRGPRRPVREVRRLDCLRGVETIGGCATGGVRRAGTPAHAPLRSGVSRIRRLFVSSTQGVSQ